MKWHPKLLLLITALLGSAQTVYCDNLFDTATQIATDVRARGDLQSETRKCPVDIMARRESRGHLQGNDCQTAAQLPGCFSRCSEGDGAACYWLAYAMQQAGTPPVGHEPLYQRACKLGIMSGCTNRAAGMLADAPENRGVQRCAAQTFAKVCTFDDPWACIMYARHLARGKGVAQNPELALKVLEKSCNYGPDDPACDAGMRLKAEITQTGKSRQ